MPKQRVPQIFTLIRFYVDPLILIPSIQHEKMGQRKNLRASLFKYNFLGSMNRKPFP